MDRKLKVLNATSAGDYELECGSQRFSVFLGRGFAKQGDTLTLSAEPPIPEVEPLPEPKTKKSFMEKLKS